MKYKNNDMIIITDNPYKWKSVEIGKQYTIDNSDYYYTLKENQTCSYLYEYLEDISKLDIMTMRKLKLERILK